MNSEQRSSTGTAELLPCPFCARDVDLINGNGNPDIAPRWLVVCEVCGSFHFDENEIEQEVSARWNIRITAQPMRPTIIDRICEAWSITLGEPAENWDMQPPLDERYTSYVLNDAERSQLRDALGYGITAQRQPDPKVVAAVQQAIMSHPFWNTGVGSPAFAFGLANTAIKAYTSALPSTDGSADQPRK